MYSHLQTVKDSKTVASLGRTLDFMDQAVVTFQHGPAPPEVAEGLAGRILGLVGQENAIEECRSVAQELRKVGGWQDRALSRCRMAVRWLEQQARMAPLRDPASAELARTVESRAEQFLRSQ